MPVGCVRWRTLGSGHGVIRAHAGVTLPWSRTRWAQPRPLPAWCHWRSGCGSPWNFPPGGAVGLASPAAVDEAGRGEPPVGRRVRPSPGKRGSVSPLILRSNDGACRYMCARGQIDMNPSQKVQIITPRIKYHWSMRTPSFWMCKFPKTVECWSKRV